jgi:hypothetical protein
MYSHQQLDLFLAGDSVLQGVGVPSVVEWLRAQIPLRMWNLSIRGYGPRQKISALIAYALPKQPQWLIVEFYAANDLAEEIRNEVCDSTGDFRCRYNEPAVRRRLAQHPVYPTIFRIPTDVFTTLADVATHNVTLATTRYLIDAMKRAIKTRLTPRGDLSAPGREEEDRVYNIHGPPGSLGFKVRQGQWLAYLRAGMALTQNSYERLVAKLAGMKPRPTVILLYNPTPYELYREMWVDPKPEADQASAVQREVLRAFAHTHGWRFLDLTDPLRQEVQARQVWLYGRYDTGHWSPQGTAVVAAVLAAELLRIIGP